MRVRDERVEKRLDMFLICDALADDQRRIRQWVGTRGDFDHLPYLLS
jgi:hypothetical protein